MTKISKRKKKLRHMEGILVEQIRFAGPFHMIQRFCCYTASCSNGKQNNS